MFMLRSTCLCVLCHVFAQIYMFLLRSMWLCLDLCVYVLHAIFVCLDLCWLLCHIILQPFCSFISLFLVFWPLLVGCRSRSCGLGLHLHTQAYIKGFGSFPLHVYVCLLASMLYRHVSLSRSRLCHALCPRRLVLGWLHPYPLQPNEVSPLVRYTSVVLVCLIHTFLHPVQCLYACLACLVPPIWLSLLLLHLCTSAYMFMHKSVCQPYSNPMELLTLNPNQHLSSQDTVFCLIACLSPLSYACLACFVCPHLAFFVSMLFVNSPYLFCFFLACLLSCFFCLCTYTHGAQTFRARV